MNKSLTQTARWWDVREHLPEEGEIHLLYSAIKKEYMIGKWTAALGWEECDNSSMHWVTHWLDTPNLFPFPTGGEVDRKLADEYGKRRGNED